MVKGLEGAKDDEEEGRDMLPCDDDDIEGDDDSVGYDWESDFVACGSLA